MKSSGELESLSLTIKSMFCEREKVPVINTNQENDKSTQGYLSSFIVDMFNAYWSRTSNPATLLFKRLTTGLLPSISGLPYHFILMKFIMLPW